MAALPSPGSEIIRQKLIPVVLIAGAIGVAIYGLASALSSTPPAPVPESADVAWEVETIAEGLQIPWAIAFSNDGRLFFTERVGRLNVIDKPGQRPRILADIPGVATSQHPKFATGLLGLAVDPDYAREPYLYVLYTYREGARLFDRVVRYREVDGRAVEDAILLDSIPGSPWQNGGRIAFGPDGKLYVATGSGRGGPGITSIEETSLEEMALAATRGDLEAQDINSLACKILRINRDGTLPSDNPFPASPVYSYGHRHSQGLAWHPTTGQFYITEHGPPGGWDEINLVEAGGNYGWPRFKGHTASIKFNLTFFTPQHYQRPIAAYTPSIAPSGATFYSGKVFSQWTNSLFIATLGGRHLRRVVLGADGRSISREERLLDGTYGRLRAVVEGPDGFLYLSTSNRDQSGKPASGDDRILRIIPKQPRAVDKSGQTTLALPPDR